MVKLRHAGLSLILAVFAASCSVGGSSGQSESPSETKKTNLTPEREKALRESGVMMPGKLVEVDQTEAVGAEESARGTSGGRGAFAPMHDGGVTLLPVASSLMLTENGDAQEVRETIISLTSTISTAVTTTTIVPTTVVPTTVVPTTVVATTGVTVTTKPADEDCPKPEKVCAEACATATATAYAFAFAHASATACAWAEAWACVYTFDPFSRVCSWAQSSACSSAFATAFGFGFGFDTQTVCNKQCAGGG
jgi:hypothetical protein